MRLARELGAESGKRETGSGKRGAGSGEWGKRERGARIVLSVGTRILIFCFRPQISTKNRKFEVW
jgi:hypothetical protein